MIEFDLGMKIGIILSMALISFEASLLNWKWGFFDWYMEDIVNKVRRKVK